MSKISQIKHRWFTGLIAAGWVSLSIGVASATLSAADEAMLREKFAAADIDKNGQLTLAETKAGMPRVAKGFAKIDAQNKGYITLDEILAFAGGQ